MKQTAVEWFADKIGHNSLMALTEYNEILEQAKAMEKEQIIDAYAHGQNNGYMYRDGQSNIIEAEQYYTETYESNT